MRGKVGSLLFCFYVCRITPAYAGKRITVVIFGYDDEDHPRVCGEKNGWRLGWAERVGSPPRMRGKGLRTVSKSLPRGITPAYAGKSAGAGGMCPRAGDHPRVCGEKTGAIAVSSGANGSPPRMRGKEKISRRFRL